MELRARLHGLTGSTTRRGMCSGPSPAFTFWVNKRQAPDIFVTPELKFNYADIRKKFLSRWWRNAGGRTAADGSVFYFSFWNICKVTWKLGALIWLVSVQQVLESNCAELSRRWSILELQICPCSQLCPERMIFDTAKATVTCTR